MMGKSLFQNLGWLGSASLISKPVWFLFLIYAARVLGPADFGAYVALFSLSLLLSSVLELGLDVQITQSISTAKENVLRLATQSVLLRLATSIVLSLFGFVVFTLFYADAYPPTVFIAAFSIGLIQFLLNHFRAIFRGMERLDLESLSLMLEKIGVPVFLVYWFGAKPQFDFFLISLVSALGVSLACTFVLLILGVWRLHKKISSRSIQSTGALIRQAFPFAVMNFSLIWFARIGSTLIERVLTQKDAGYLGVGTRFLDALTVIPSTLSAVTYPVLCRITDSPRLFTELCTLTSRIANATTLVIVGILYFFSEQITVLVFGDEYLTASSIVRIYSMTMLILSQVFIIGAAVAAMRLQHQANKWLIGSVGVSIISYVVLLPSLNVNGFAWLALLDQGLILASSLIAIRGYISLKAPLINLTKGFMVFILWIGIDWVLHKVDIPLDGTPFTETYMPIISLLVYVGFLGSLWLTGVIQYRDGYRFLHLSDRL
jgi:O-antigen/teichoic acid export membrane protein